MEYDVLPVPREIVFIGFNGGKDFVMYRLNNKSNQITKLVIMDG